MHVQNEDGSIEITQDHYISELKAIPLTQEQKADVSVGADDTLHGQFLALQGALGWAANTRHDVAVYICALQRDRFESQRVRPGCRVPIPREPHRAWPSPRKQMDGVLTRRNY